MQRCMEHLSQGVTCLHHAFLCIHGCRYKGELYRAVATRQLGLAQGKAWLWVHLFCWVACFDRFVQPAPPRRDENSLKPGAGNDADPTLASAAKKARVSQPQDSPAVALDASAAAAAAAAAVAALQAEVAALPILAQPQQQLQQPSLVQASTGLENLLDGRIGLDLGLLQGPGGVSSRCPSIP